jgi:D-inositol-3-phosphate glycosyltransferase
MKQKDSSSAFLQSKRPHILMVTNHGIHDWEGRPGLTDTGGQNHYVRQLSDTLVDLGYRVTTFNRGGFPDPTTGEMRTGALYKDSNQRIVYLEGGGNEFIRKEDLTREILAEEAGFAERLMKEERLPVDLIVSHYWDAAVLVQILKDNMKLQAKHVWVPHSIGTLKQENFKGKPADIVEPLRFPERIAYEKGVLPHVDAVASTSGDISKHLKENYGRDPELFLPPCINTAAIHPIDNASKIGGIYDFLAETDPKTGAKVKGRPAILEMSRTDRTKRKDIVLRAFAQALKKNPDAMLLLRLAPKPKDLHDELVSLAESLGIRDNVVFVGMVPDELMVELFNIATVYLSPSEMEGFGMSVQEAAASARPTISSSLIPFAVEYLARDGKDETIQTGEGPLKIRWGTGGAIIPAGRTEGFGYALGTLLDDEGLRKSMAKAAYEITIPYFTWPNVTRKLLEQVGLKPPAA